MATLLERAEEIRDETRGGYNNAARYGGLLVDMLGKSGTATIDAECDPPSATVTHGCDNTPTANQIIITPTSALGAAVHYWVESIGATTFKIVLDNVAGVSVTFSWRVIA